MLLALHHLDSYLIVALLTIKTRVPLLSMLKATSSDWSFSVLNKTAGVSVKFTQIISVNSAELGQHLLS